MMKKIVCRCLLHLISKSKTSALLLSIIMIWLDFGGFKLSCVINCMESLNQTCQIAFEQKKQICMRTTQTIHVSFICLYILVDFQDPSR